MLNKTLEKENLNLKKPNNKKGGIKILKGIKPLIESHMEERGDTICLEVKKPMHDIEGEATQELSLVTLMWILHNEDGVGV